MAGGGVVNDDQLFETESLEMPPERVAPAQAPPPVVVTRKPGWVLVGRRDGPQGFHRVYGAGQNGTLVTVCGVVGRKIDDSQTVIVECPICAS